MKLNRLLLPILLVMALLFGACSVSMSDEPKETKKTTAATTTAESTTAATEMTTAATEGTTTGTTPPTTADTQTEPESEDLILGSLCDMEVEYTDEYDNVYRYSYHLPYAAQGAGAEWFNEEMDKLMSEDVDPSYSDVGGEIGPTWTSVEYTVGQHGDITSVLITFRDLWYDAFYRVYNLGRDGSPVDNEAMMAEAGMIPQVCLDEMYLALDRYTAIDEIQSPDWAIPELEAARKRTLAPSNYSLDDLMFFDAAGSFGFIGNVYSIAGADCYLHPFVWVDGGFEIADEGPHGTSEHDDTLFRDLNWLYGEWEATYLADEDGAWRNVGLVFFPDGTGGYNFVDPEYVDYEYGPDSMGPETLEFYDGEWSILLDDDTAYPRGSVVLELARRGGIYAMDGMYKDFWGVFYIVPKGDLLEVTHIDGQALIPGWEGETMYLENLVHYTDVPE